MQNLSKLFNLTLYTELIMKKIIAATILTVASASASAWWSNGPFSNNGTGNGNGVGNGDFDTDMSFSMNASSKAHAKGNGTSTANGQNGYGPYNGYNNNWGPMDGLMDGTGNGDASFGFSMKARGNAKASGESRGNNHYGYAPYGYPVAVPVLEEVATPEADKKS